MPEPETEHRTEGKAAGILHGALEKILSRFTRHDGTDAGNAESDHADHNYGGNESETSEPEPEEPETEEDSEEYTKAEYYMLTREERCHLKAQREMEQLGRKSQVFSQCLISCVQTPVRDGIAIGCPNVPIYRLVRAYTEDTKYLFPIYEP